MRNVRPAYVGSGSKAEKLRRSKCFPVCARNRTSGLRIPRPSINNTADGLDRIQPSIRRHASEESE